MLVIRYNRTGRRNKPFFRLVVQEKTIAPGGRHTEVVGSWDPHAKVAVLKEDRIRHWISVGAQPSDSVYNLLVTKGVIEGKKRAVKMPKKESTVDNEQGEKEEEKKVEGSDKVEAPKEETKEEKPEEKKEDEKDGNVEPKEEKK